MVHSYCNLVVCHSHYEQSKGIKSSAKYIQFTWEEEGDKSRGLNTDAYVGGGCAIGARSMECLSVSVSGGGGPL